MVRVAFCNWNSEHQGQISQTERTITNIVSVNFFFKVYFLNTNLRMDLPLLIFELKWLYMYGHRMYHVPT